MYVSFSNGRLNFGNKIKLLSEFGVNDSYTSFDTHPRIFGDINADGIKL